MEIILIIALLIMLVGLSGIVLPIIPSTPLILAGIVIYAACDGFESISRLLLLSLGVLTIFSVVIDYFGGVIGAKKFGA
ncbi:MAG TPA: DUF456 family protein, partial [Candidatus Scalindua sp.]|nr:DUF456 family protein [Candidatus Scalindua sp.]